MHLPFRKGINIPRSLNTNVFCSVQFAVVMQAINTHLLNLIVLNKAEKAAGRLEKTK
jgi:hypothetical protein